MSDEALMERVRAGDMQALGALFERYKQPLFGFLTRFVSDHALAEDVLLDTFMRVYDRRTTFRHDGKFSTWLYTIAHNLAVDRLKRSRRWECTSELDDDIPTPTPDPSLEAYTRLELAGVVKEAVNALPAEQRAVIILREFEEMSYREIAAVTGATEEAVRVRAHRARQALKKKLEPYVKEDACLR